jgi:hypothetical protein
MSEHGSVSRGVCLADEKQLLKSVTERTNIRYSGGEIVYSDGNSDVPLDADTLVSMNFWGFTPEYFRQTEPMFKDFLSSNPGSLTSEYYIPTAVDYLINNDKATVACLTSDARWFGVTYKEDKPLVINKLSQLIQAGVYPAQLWK